MARLREQARLVEAAYNICGCDENWKPKNVYEAANKMTGVMSEAEIVNAALEVKIFNDDGKNFAKEVNDKNFWHRRSKIGSLFKNSVNDGFFIKDKSKEKGGACSRLLLHYWWWYWFVALVRFSKSCDSKVF